MSEDSSSSTFGSYIHSTLPKGFHVNPFKSEVIPNSQLQNSSFSFQEYRRNSEFVNTNEEEEIVTEEATIENDERIIMNQEETTVSQLITEDIVEVDDMSEETHVNTPIHNALNSFGNFIFDIYQSSAYYVPTNQSSIRNRFQYMREYYRRMMQLIESSSKQEAASEETIKKLCVNIYFSVDWCPICLEDYIANMVTSVLPCGHRFHLCCLKSWLHINHTCPVCKLVV